MEEKVQALEREVTQLQVSLGQVTEAFNADKTLFMDSVQTEFITHKLAMEQVVMEAREEFQHMNSAMQALNGNLGIAMTELKGGSRTWRTRVRRRRTTTGDTYRRKA